MEFIQDLVPTVGGVLAAIASLVAVIVAIDQLTLRSRMRRVVAWTKELLDVEDDQHRKDALVFIRDRAAASMVASTWLPMRHIAEGVVWLVGGAALIVVTLVRDRGVGGALLAAGVAFFAAHQGVRRAIRMYVERERVRAEYLDFAKVVPPRTDILANMEGGTRAEYGWAALLVVGYLALTFGVSWFVYGERTIWPALIVMAGIAVLQIALGGVRKLGGRARKMPTLAGVRES